MPLSPQVTQGVTVPERVVDSDSQGRNPTAIPQKIRKYMSRIQGYLFVVPYAMISQLKTIAT